MPQLPPLPRPTVIVERNGVQTTRFADWMLGLWTALNKLLAGIVDGDWSISGNLSVGGNANITGNVTATNGTFSGALAAASAAIAGALTAGSAAITGALSAASASLTGTLDAAAATLSGASAILKLIHTGAAANARRWRVISFNGGFFMQALNDAETTVTTAFFASQAGGTVTGITLGATTVPGAANTQDFGVVATPWRKAFIGATVGRVVAPAAFAANQTDLVVANLANCSVIALSATAPITIRSLDSTGFEDGRPLVLANISGNAITLPHEDVLGTANFRFFFYDGANRVLGNGRSVMMHRNPSLNNRWVLVGA